MLGLLKQSKRRDSLTLRPQRTINPLAHNQSTPPAPNKTNFTQPTPSNHFHPKQTLGGRRARLGDDHPAKENTAIMKQMEKMQRQMEGNQQKYPIPSSKTKGKQNATKNNKTSTRKTS